MKSGIVYKIVAFETDKVYIGSTTQDIRTRLYEHRRRYKNMGGETSSREIIQHPTNNIILLEKVDDVGEKCINLRQREDYWIRYYKGKAVNQQRAVANKEETRERQKAHFKKYRQNNIERFITKDKEYYEKNRERILEQKKEYNRNNKEKIQKKNQNYYQNNKEKYQPTEEKAERRRELYQQNKDYINSKRRHNRSEFGKLCRLFDSV